MARNLYFGEPRRLDLVIDTTALAPDATYRTDIRVIASVADQVVTNDVPIILQVGNAPETHSAPSVPHLVSPIDRTQLARVRSNIFSWSPATNSSGDACLYTVHMDCNIGASNFPAVVAEGLTVTTNVAEQLAYQQTYIWRVVAMDTNTGMQTFSETWTFNTPANNPTASVTLIDGVFWFDRSTPPLVTSITNTGTGELAWQITKDDDQLQNVDFCPANGCCERGYRDGYVITIASRYEKAAYEEGYTLATSVTNFSLLCGGYFPSLLDTGWMVTPQSGASYVPINTTLSWTHGKLPESTKTAASTWHVFFGTINPPPHYTVIEGRTLDVNSLGRGVTYYWFVSNCVTLLAGTSQEHQAPLKSPVFSFTTYGDCFVSPTHGSDSNLGTLEHPMKTISNAIALATAGVSKIWLAGETYNESVTVDKAVTISSLDGYRWKNSQLNDPKQLRFQTVKNTVFKPANDQRAFTITSPGVKIEGVTFDGGGLVDMGGAILCSGNNVNPEITRCCFKSRNRANILGGAVAAVDGAAPRITACIFANSRSQQYGGAIGISNANAAVQIAHCTFAKNYAKVEGGAIAILGGTGACENDGDTVCNIDEFNGGSDMGNANSTPNSVAEWRFDGLWADSSGWGQQLVPTGAVSFVAGKVGRCALFGGCGYASVASTNLDLLSFPRSFAMSAWIIWTNTAGAQTILTKGPADNPNYRLQVTTNGALRFTAGSTTAETFKNAVKQGEWTHVGVAAWSGRFWELYVNGAIVRTATSIGAFPTNSETVVVGADADGTSIWQGAIDEMELFNWAIWPADMARWYGLGLTVTFRENFEADELDTSVWYIAASPATIGNAGAWRPDWYLADGELYAEVNIDRTYARFNVGIANNYAVEYREAMATPISRDFDFYFGDGHYMNSIGGWANSSSTVGWCSTTGTWGLIGNNFLTPPRTDILAATDRWMRIEIAQHDGAISVHVDSNDVFEILTTTNTWHGSNMAFRTYGMNGTNGRAENRHDDLVVRRTLVGEWRFDNSIQDSSTLGNHGSMYSGVDKYCEGIEGNALLLSGGSGISMHETGTLAPADRMTLQAWVRPLGEIEGEGIRWRSPGIRVQGVLEKWDAYWNRGYLLTLSNGVPRLLLGTVTGVVEVVGGSLPSNQWTLLTATWNTFTRQVNLYVGGLCVASNTIYAPVVSPISAATIGSGYDGKLENAKVYTWPLSQLAISNEAARTILPDTPQPVTPTNGTSDATIAQEFVWTGDNPDGQALTNKFIIRTGTYAFVTITTTNHTVLVTGLSTNTPYTWQIVAYDGFGHARTGGVWSFTTTVSRDSDGDGMDDATEIALGRDPLNPFDGSGRFSAALESDYKTVDIGLPGRVDVWFLTNRYYEKPHAKWRLLASGATTLHVHTDATNWPSVYYRLVSGHHTSEYDTGKFDFVSLQNQDAPGGSVQNSDYYIDDFSNGSTNWFPNRTLFNSAGYVLFLPKDHPAVKLTGVGMVPTNDVLLQVPFQSVPWAAVQFPVSTDMRASGVTNLFHPPHLYSGFDYDFIDWQETLGGPVWYAEYFIDNWGTGATNFFPSVKGADKFIPGSGYLLFFNSSRTGTGTWHNIKPY